MTEAEKILELAKMVKESAEESIQWQSKYHEAIAAQEREKEKAQQSGDAMAVLRALRTA